VFRHPSSSHITDRYIALRILYGDDETAATHAWCKRYSVGATPSLVVMTPSGRKIFSWTGFRELPEILALLVKAEKRWRLLPALETELRADSSLEGKQKLARLLADVYDDAQALPLLIELGREAPLLEDQLLLAHVADRNNDRATYKAVLNSLIAEHPRHKDRTDWRLQVALTAHPNEFLKGEAFMKRQLENIEIYKQVLDATTDKQERAYLELTLGRRHEFISRFPEAPKNAWEEAEKWYRKGLATIELDAERHELLDVLGRAAMTVSPTDRVWVKRLIKFMEGMLKQAEHRDERPWLESELTYLRDSLKR